MMNRVALQPSARPQGRGLSPHRAARILAVIRLVNGGAALFTPHAMARRFGVNPDVNPAAIHILRLFGVRTVVLGAELLLAGKAPRRELLTIGVGIHAADTAAAVAAGLRHELPARGAIAGALISSMNTALAIRSLR